MLIGIPADNNRLGDVNNRLSDLRGDMNRRFDDVNRLLEDTRDLLRAESFRVEQVLDARLKHLEEDR